MVEWFYGKGGQQFGPIDEMVLRARITSGEVESQDLIWTEGMAAWTPLSQLPQFGSVAPVISVPPVMPVDSAAGVDVSSPYAPPLASLEGVYPQGPPLPTTNGLAIASMVCGILSLVFFCFCGGLFFGLPAVICGHLALRQLNNLENMQGGRGMAQAGLICGYCGLVIFAAWMIRVNWYIHV